MKTTRLEFEDSKGKKKAEEKSGKEQRPVRPKQILVFPRLLHRVNARSVCRGSFERAPTS